jgi:hypothetical protein
MLSFQYKWNYINSKGICVISLFISPVLDLNWWADLVVKDHQHLPTPRWPRVCGIIEWLLVIVVSSDYGDCEGFLCLPYETITKDNSSGLLVACVASLVWFLQRPCVGLGMCGLLVHEPPSEYLSTTWTKLPASSRTTR